jgi:protein-S-isoprenylcysteine O-methyltransferase Ste14
MRALELKIPPPLVALIIAVTMWIARNVAPTLELSPATRIVAAGVVAVIGGYFSIAGTLAFRRARTTVNPLKPENASSLVTSGVYRITRNPMYVALALLLVAWSFYLSAPALLAGSALFVLYVTRFQIQPEERVLRRMFGNEYTSYTQRVRRWL